jgi:crossover junction endodeoxyribonuclease RusA
MAIVTIIIPGQPVPKGRPRVYRGKGVTPKKTREAENIISGTALRECNKLHWGSTTAPVAAKIYFYLSKARGRVPDLDNLVKLVLDGCQGIVFKDDSQIHHMLATRYRDCPEAYTKAMFLVEDR